MTVWLVLLGVNVCYAQSADNEGLNATRLGFYNLQNLFDTINDPGVNDAEFVDNQQYDYNLKIKELARAIWLFKPDVLGVCEVENYGVLSDLTEELNVDGNITYNIVHYDSRDSRGIDVALLYNSAKFEVEESELLDFEVTTRGFLRVKLAFKQIDNNGFVVYVAHLPSKRGAQQAKLRRERASEILDSLALSEPSKRVVMCGDFNDDPDLKPVLCNMAYRSKELGLASYAYGGVWSMLDQIIITPELLRYIKGNQRVVLHKSLITKSGKYKGYPKRSHPSDHLPVYIDFY